MTTQEIANRLVELCRKGDFKKAQEELYADDAISIEQEASPAFAKETKGKKAIEEKGEKWNAMVEETKSITVSDPLVAANAIALTMRLNVVMKEHGPMDMTEVCVYKIKDGKIASEEFFM